MPVAGVGRVGPSELRALADKLVGLFKEAAGTVVGNESLRESGEAQQARGTKQLRAARARARGPANQAKQAAPPHTQHA